MSLHETLLEILSHLRDLHARLDKFELQKPQAPELKQKTKQFSLENLKRTIITHISDQWQAHNLPISVANLSRRFHRQARIYGTLTELLEELSEDSRIWKFRNLTGATSYCLPIDIYKEMASHIYEQIEEIGLTKLQISKYRAKKTEIRKANKTLETEQLEIKKLIALEAKKLEELQNDGSEAPTPFQTARDNESDNKE